MVFIVVENCYYIIIPLLLWYDQRVSVFNLFSIGTPTQKFYLSKWSSRHLLFPQNKAKSAISSQYIFLNKMLRNYTKLSIPLPFSSDLALPIIRLLLYELPWLGVRFCLVRIFRYMAWIQKYKEAYLEYSQTSKMELSTELLDVQS